MSCLFQAPQQYIYCWILQYKYCNIFRRYCNISSKANILILATRSQYRSNILLRGLPILQVDPAPARRRRRVTWRESLEDVRTLVYPSRLPARIRNPTNFLTMSTFSNRTQNHESLPASSSQE